MIVGTAPETYPGERRVAITPATAAGLVQAGFEVRLVKGSGARAGYDDGAYEERGARLLDTRQALFAEADVVLQVRGAGANEVEGSKDLPLIRPGQALVGFYDPLSAHEMVARLAERGATLFAMELIPRITKAQSMDALSSMATVAGYKAVLLAAERLPRMFPLMMTAAGTLSPARVFVIGAGVAGLQAIATARRLGAVVEAYDLRPAVKEQVQSLGARFLELPLEGGAAEDAGGYARSMDEGFYRRQRELMAHAVRENDVVITTAAIPGKQAPLLLTSDMVTAMKPGSVIVDLAAERGGNCELTQPDEEVERAGVTILGPLNLAATVPFHASQMYAKNVSALLMHLKEKGEPPTQTSPFQPDLNDEITRETLVAAGGGVVHPAVREAMGLSTSV
jgi:NAD(P) transhydrogenase subunit alpha